MLEEDIVVHQLPHELAHQFLFLQPFSSNALCQKEHPIKEMTIKLLVDILLISTPDTSRACVPQFLLKLAV